ncbi:hypothetical protein JO40_06420 [Treponema putidum]|nr:hypothetical protein JO40_06420 [Treponema putidum]
MRNKKIYFITISFLFILILICSCKTTDTDKKQNYSQAEYFNIAGNRAKKTVQGLYTIIQKPLKQTRLMSKPI